MGKCLHPDCDNDAETYIVANGSADGMPCVRTRPYCSACRKRTMRKATAPQARPCPMRGNRHETGWQRLTEAALAYADADSDNDAEYVRACMRLRAAAHAYRGRPRHNGPR